MFRFRVGVFVMLAFVAAGCKTNSGLAEREARAQISNGIFDRGSATQTVVFVSGAVETQPLAVNQFLFSKHWTACASETGALASAPRCALDAEGATYGRANHWMAAETPTTDCPKCVTWTIPVAKARLGTVGPVDVRDDAHASVPYTYEVTPNEFGTGFGEWTASHAVAWCGEDPVAVGRWNAPRQGSASFAKTNSGWALADPPAKTFLDTFANDQAVPKPCSQGPAI